MDYITILIQNFRAKNEGGRNSFMNKTGNSFSIRNPNNPFRTSNNNLSTSNMNDSNISDYNVNRNSTVSDYFPNKNKK